MKIKNIQKTSSLAGEIQVAGSKSYAIRCIIIAALADGTSCLRNIPMIQDVNNALDVIQDLGASVKIISESILNNTMEIHISGIQDVFDFQVSKLNTGNSGLTTHLLMPLLALDSGVENICLNVGAQMAKRPVGPLIKACRDLGADIESGSKESSSAFPLIYKSPMKSGEIEIEGSSSQYITGLLVSLPLLKGDSKLIIKNLRSRPYLELTIDLLNSCGINLEHSVKSNHDEILISGGQKFRPLDIDIPGDYSSAACLIVLAAITESNILVRGLKPKSLQADSVLIQILLDMGADISWVENGLQIHGGKSLKGIEIDCYKCPDLVPALAALACFAEGVTNIKNVEHARHKETDRIDSMVKGLRKMGAKIDERQDGMSIMGSKLHAAVVDGCSDHRTIMSLLLAATQVAGESVVENVCGLTKTMPNFINLINNVGCKVKLENIVVMGFTHTGKSTTASILAKQLGLKCVDLDAEILLAYNSRHGEDLTIDEIFAKHGQNYFRKIEKDILIREIQDQTPKVLSLGGGAVMDPVSQEFLANQTNVLLNSDLTNVADRMLKHGVHGFLNLENPNRQELIKKLATVYSERESGYNRLASYTVENNSSRENLIHQIEELSHILNQE